MAVQRLHHHRAVLVAERVDLVEIARDQRWRHQMRGIHHEQLSGALRTLAGSFTTSVFGCNPLEQMRRSDVGKIKRRVLPQQDDVEGGELLTARLTRA